VGGQHQGAESAETSTPCITWGSTTTVGENPPSHR